jgi:hypothetical protein
MQKLFIPVGAVVLLLLGVALGWLAGRFLESPTAAGEVQKQPVVRFRPENPQLLAEPPSWEEWKYPNSQLHSSVTGGARTMGELPFGSTDKIALKTPDDFDKVWSFYQEKGKLLPPGTGGGSIRVEAWGNGKQIAVKLFDDLQTGTLLGPEHESVKARGFVVHSLRYQLCGFVYRPAAAEETTIFLFYRPNKEFLGLLKDRLADE